MSRDDRFLNHAQLAELAPQLQQYLDDECSVEIGSFDAQGLLVFISARIGPAIYNRALSDARLALDARMESLQAALWELERDN